VFAGLEVKVQGKHCDGMTGILKEGAAVMGEDLDKTTMDACLIAAAQRIEHYEMASYGTLVAWARSLDRPAAADLLEETLNEEESTDSRLSSLARDGINQKAAGAVAAMASPRRMAQPGRPAVVK
jgi:ferritin-like metal-binding protein YciE